MLVAKVAREQGEIRRNRFQSAVSCGSFAFARSRSCRSSRLAAERQVTVALLTKPDPRFKVGFGR